MASQEIEGSIRAKMAVIEPSPGEDLHGLVDIGSNGIRFSISDLSAPRSRLLTCIYRERAAISLYDDLSSSTSAVPSFSQDIITLVADTVSRYNSICEQYGVAKHNIIVFATEAMRKATNQADMLHAIKEKSGLLVDILEGNMESLFGAIGARSGFENVDGLFMDLGGGSVQMTYMNSKGGDSCSIQSISAARSLPYGAARLRSHLQTFNTTQAEELRNTMKKDMQATFNAVKETFPQLKKQLQGDGVTIYLCGGGFRGYGSMLMHNDPIQPYPIPAIGGYSVTGHRFEDWKGVWQAHKDAKGKKIFGMSRSRREQIEGTLLVIRSVIKAVPKIKEVVFCSGGNREGVLLMKLPPAMREQTPLSILPGGVQADPEVLESVAETLRPLFTPDIPQTGIPDDLLNYIAKNIYAGIGNSDDINSTKALHSPISGPLAGLPGFTHQTRAIIALVMCARWGADVGCVDRELYNNLQKLVGPDLSFLCSYIGVAARFLATVVPVLPKTKDVLQNELRFETMLKGNNIQVIIFVKSYRLIGLKTKKLCNAFVDLIGFKYKLKVEIVDL